MIGASRPNTLPPSTMNANARPLSACDRSRSLHNAAFVALAGPPKLTGRIVRMTTSASESTNGMAKLTADSSRPEATTPKKQNTRKQQKKDKRKRKKAQIAPPAPGGGAEKNAAAS